MKSTEALLTKIDELEKLLKSFFIVNLACVFMPSKNSALPYKDTRSDSTINSQEETIINLKIQNEKLKYRIKHLTKGK